MIVVEIISEPIKSFQPQNNNSQNGAELVFNGRVRGVENGEPIKYLDYEQYEGMAETELRNLANKACSKFPINDLFCRHRVGKVKAGETSLHVVILSKHRKESIEAMDWFILELKKHVPIWKWAILKDGIRVPSECAH